MLPPTPDHQSASSQSAGFPATPFRFAGALASLRRLSINSIGAAAVAQNKTYFDHPETAALPALETHPSAIHSSFRSKANLEGLQNLVHVLPENPEPAKCLPYRRHIPAWRILKNSAGRRAGLAIAAFRKIGAWLSRGRFLGGPRRQKEFAPGSPSQIDSANNLTAVASQSTAPDQNKVARLVPDSSGHRKS